MHPPRAAPPHRPHRPHHAHTTGPGAGPNVAIPALAVALVITGLFLFTHAQTQPLLRVASGMDPAATQTATSDAGILLGAAVAATGAALLLGHLGPLRGTRRLVPTGVFLATAALLMMAHFSIFTNGVTLPGQRTVEARTSFLFHDTTATVPEAVFLLALLSFLLIAVCLLAALALVRPRTLRDNVLSPTTPAAHRARVLAVSLLFFTVAVLFIKRFVAYASPTATATAGNAAQLHLIMAIVLTALLALLTWRTVVLLWGRAVDTMGGRERRRRRSVVRAENALLTILVATTGAVLLHPPVYEPQGSTDAVFAVSSRGVTWVFLLSLGIYLLQRWTTRAARRHGAVGPATTRMGRDPLAVVAAASAALVLAGALWTGSGSLTPLAGLTLMLLGLVLVAPLIGLAASAGRRRRQRRKAGAPGATAPLWLLWAALSILTGIMLWGIGNSVHVVYSGHAGGLLSPQGRLLDPSSAAVRLLGSALIAAPPLLGAGLLAARNGAGHRAGRVTTVAGATAVFTLFTLFTIEASRRFDAGMGRVDIVVGYWSTSLPTAADALFMSGLLALTATFTLASAAITLHRGAERPPPRVPRGQAWRTPAPVAERDPRATHRSGTGRVVRSG